MEPEYKCVVALTRTQTDNDPSAEAKSCPKAENNLKTALKMATEVVGDVIRDEREARCRMGGRKDTSR